MCDENYPKEFKFQNFELYVKTFLYIIIKSRGFAKIISLLPQQNNKISVVFLNTVYHTK